MWKGRWNSRLVCCVFSGRVGSIFIFYWNDFSLRRKMLGGLWRRIGEYLPWKIILLYRHRIKRLVLSIRGTLMHPALSYHARLTFSGCDQVCALCRRLKACPWRVYLGNFPGGKEHYLHAQHLWRLSPRQSPHIWSRHHGRAVRANPGETGGNIVYIPGFLNISVITLVLYGCMFNGEIWLFLRKCVM